MSSPSPQNSSSIRNKPKAIQPTAGQTPLKVSDLEANEEAPGQDSPRSPESALNRLAETTMKTLMLKLETMSINAKDVSRFSREESELTGSIPRRTTSEDSSILPPSRAKGFVLDPQYADMLFIEPAYFVVFPNVYVFEKHRIICQVDEAGRFHEVKSMKCNPPELEAVFHINSIPYSFDQYNRLWVNLAEQWHYEILHPDLAGAREELARCAENTQIAISDNPPIIGALPTSGNVSPKPALSLLQD